MNTPQTPQGPFKRTWAWYQRRRNLSKVSIGCAISLVALIVCFIAIGALAGPPTTQSPQTQSLRSNTPTNTPPQQVITQKKPTPTLTPVPIATPTPASAPKPTPKPTSTPLTPPVLGGTVSAFTTNYGTPDAHTDTKSGSYHYQKYADSNIDYIIAWADLPDGGAYAQKIYSLGIQADDAGWSADKVTTMCAPFLPRDAVFKNKVVLSDGSGNYDEIYTSAILASAFPAASFTDTNTNPVKAGTFDMLVGVNADSTINGCTLQIGTQQTQ